MKKKEIINCLEDFAPLELQEQWDNSGWQIKSDKDEIKKVLLCVSVTKDIIKQAIEQGVELVVAHHPLIFPDVKNIVDERFLLAIKNDIQIYSMHTNFDKVKDGTTACLAKILGFDELVKVNDFVQAIHLSDSLNIDDIILKTKLALNVEKIKVINYKCKKFINNIAFCAGAGGCFISDISEKFDLYITSDVKYHEAEQCSGGIILDVGHLESERPSLIKIKELLNDKGLEIVVANEKTNAIFI